MKLLKLKVTNFGSYPSFEMDLRSQGLTLIYGPTGAGKSTIMDMAAWTLFGCTAKGGNADEVRSWLTNEPTRGELYVETDDKKVIVVVRERGANRDVYCQEAQSGADSAADEMGRTSDSSKLRGKDAVETQRLIETRLGVNKELFLTGAYFHEFSRSGSFFVAKANERRQLLESLADVKLANNLMGRASEHRKEARGDLSSCQSRLDRADERVRLASKSLERTRNASVVWQENTKTEIRFLKARVENFEKEKQSKIDEVKTKSDRWEEQQRKNIDKIVAKIDKTPDLEPCAACGSGGNVADKHELVERLRYVTSEDNPYFPNIGIYENMENHYSAQLLSKTATLNPHLAEQLFLEKEVGTAQFALNELISEKTILDARISDLSYLYDISGELRGELVRKAVGEIQDSTNMYLSRYFDSELKVTFSLEGSDDLEVGIQKNGNDCVYRQLSKGQRGLLKLCLAVSVMKAASNNAGIHFDNLYFDEALDGLDSDLKVKAFSLFEELEKEHASVLVIDHSPELQQLFTKRYKVSMESDVSSIEEEHE